ncbi:MAG: GNAT family N-acetyltransferase [Rhodanobacteraceae bacterium]
MKPEVTHDPAHRRFETVVDGERGVLDYEREGSAMIILHVLVPDAIGGRGIGGALTHAAFESARNDGLRVVPQCPFAEAYARKHPEFADLVIAG